MRRRDGTLLVPSLGDGSFPGVADARREPHGSSRVAVKGESGSKQVRRDPPGLGFAAGTPVLTPEDYKPIEGVKPGDFMQSGPDGEGPDD